MVVRSGSFRLSLDRSVASFLFMETPARSSWPRRLLDQLERLESIRLPPVGTISQCLGKIKREEATLTIITTYWPSFSWFPLLLEMSSDVARVLQPEENLLCSPLGVQHTLCLQEQLILIAWRLCGTAGDSEGFRQK